MSEGYYRQQAEAFLDYRRRGGGSFEFWADSKDFSDLDKNKIFKVARVIAENLGEEEGCYGNARCVSLMD